MSVVGGAVRNVGRTVNRAATATTAAAGAVGGAAVSGVVGGVKGAAEGIQRGIGTGSKSTAAAALAIGALGVAGIVEWPILLAVEAAVRWCCARSARSLTSPPAGTAGETYLGARQARGGKGRPAKDTCQDTRQGCEEDNRPAGGRHQPAQHKLIGSVDTN